MTVDVTCCRSKMAVLASCCEFGGQLESELASNECRESLNCNIVVVECSVYDRTYVTHHQETFVLQLHVAVIN
jgi:hypothetical protein